MEGRIRPGPTRGCEGILAWPCGRDRSELELDQLPRIRRRASDEDAALRGMGSVVPGCAVVNFPECADRVPLLRRPRRAPSPPPVSQGSEVRAQVTMRLHAART